jgi:hypothetical protein
MGRTGEEIGNDRLNFPICFVLMFLCLWAIGLFCSDFWFLPSVCSAPAIGRMTHHSTCESHVALVVLAWGRASSYISLSHPWIIKTTRLLQPQPKPPWTAYRRKRSPIVPAIATLISAAQIRITALRNGRGLTCSVPFLTCCLVVRRGSVPWVNLVA